MDGVGLLRLARPEDPQRGYLVRQQGDELVAVTTTENGLAAGRKAMCAVCRAVDNSTAIALFSARRAGQPGRKGNTVGTYICTDLAVRVILDQDRSPDDLAAEMLTRLDAFLDTVRA